MKLVSLLSSILLMSALCGKPSAPLCDFTPVFYGTLLEFPITNNAPGEISLAAYIYGGSFYGSYDNNWKLTGESVGMLNPELWVYVGLTHFLQIEWIIQTQTVWYKGHSDTALGDSFLGLGWQLLWEEKHTKKPNVRLETSCLFPTGKYQRLDPIFNGNNASGGGAYGPFFSFIVNKTFYTNPCHPLNVAFDLSYIYFIKTNLHGLNSYGGGPDTHGTISPGSRLLGILALEYCFTEPFHFVLDVQYAHDFPSSFHGFIGNAFDGTPASIFTNSTDSLIIAPALEFGFNSNMALYLGGYFTLAGRNATATAQGNLSFAINF